MELLGQTQIRPPYKEYDEFEQRLSARIEHELKGRKEILQHTLFVVKNMKRLVVLEGGKRDLLVTLAYVHEIAKPGENVVILDGRSPVMHRCFYCATRAKEILLELGFPVEKAGHVSSLLETNSCMELKRAHHPIQ